MDLKFISHHYVVRRPMHWFVNININVDNVDALKTPMMTYLWSATLSYSRYVKRHGANEFALHRITRRNRMPPYYINATGISLVATRAEIIHAKAATEWLSACHTNVDNSDPISR